MGRRQLQALPRRPRLLRVPALQTERDMQVSREVRQAARSLGPKYREQFAHGIFPDPAAILPTNCLERACPVLRHNRPPDGLLEGHIFTDGSSSGIGALWRAGWAVVAVDNVGNLEAAAFGAVPCDVLPGQTSRDGERSSHGRAHHLGTIATVNRPKCKALGAGIPRAPVWSFWFPTTRSGQSRSRATPHSATWRLGALPTCSKGETIMPILLQRKGPTHTSLLFETPRQLWPFGSLAKQAARWAAEAHVLLRFRGWNDTRTAAPRARTRPPRGKLNARERRRARRRLQVRCASGLSVFASNSCCTVIEIRVGHGTLVEMGFWRSGYSDWKTGSPRPNQKRLWMCTTCGQYDSSEAACSQCGLWRSWAEVVKGVQQTNSTTPPSKPKEEIKALKATLAALPDNVDHVLLWRRGFNTPAKRRETATSWTSASRGALQRASKAKQAANAQQQAAQAAFEKADADETRIRAELVELEKQALSQTTQPTCLQTISCKAAPLSAAVTELSRHMPETEESTIQNALDCIRSLIVQAAEKTSRAEAEGSATCGLGWPRRRFEHRPLKRGSQGDSQEWLRAVTRRSEQNNVRMCRWEHGCDGKHSGVTPMTVVSANTAALDPMLSLPPLEQGLRHGQRAEEFERMFDDAGAGVIAVQYTSIGSKQLDRDVVLQTYKMPQTVSSRVNVSPSGRRCIPCARVVRAKPWSRLTEKHTSAPPLNRRKHRNTKETSKFSTS